MSLPIIRSIYLALLGTKYRIANDYVEFTFDGKWYHSMLTNSLGKYIVQKT